MSARTDSAHRIPLKFGIGQPVPRAEDPRLLRGEGRYTDDINLPDQVHAVMVRSGHAHGMLRSIDTAAARAMPGVLAVYTAADLDSAGYGTIKCLIPAMNRDGTPMRQPVRRSLASGRVRFVGDPVAVVVAQTVPQAKDAAEAVVVDVDPLPAVTTPREAVKPGAPLLYDDVPGNVAVDYHHGDSAKVAEAFGRATHVTRLSLANNRLVVCAMEPRSALASFDAATGRFTLHAGSQGVFGLRNQLADDLLNVPRDKVRVVTGNVGGSFGMKGALFPEYACLFHAARNLGRPVKWTDERTGSFLSDTHGRDWDVTAELALDGEGRFLAVRVHAFANMGAFFGHVGPLMPTVNIVKNVIGMYRTPLVEVATICAFTNTTPVSAYRGAGRPEGNYIMERLVEAAARETGIDRVELRKRNHIAPSEMPYAAGSGLKYDSGDFTHLIDHALALADWNDFEARRAESRRRGRLRGRGIGAYLEVTAPPTKEMGGISFEADGTVTLTTGTLDYGQGHATPFAQVLSERLGVPFDRIRLVQGDSDKLIAGGGTGGSKSMMASGSAIVEASDKVIARGKAIAAAALEAAEADIEFRDGSFVIAGTDRAIGIMDLAARLHAGFKPPPGAPATLDVQHVFDAAPAAFPNGCHVAEVEVDPETGTVEVARYAMVNDFGTVINPLLVEGQAHGGVVQGIGQALLERTVYDEGGQLLTGSFMDYALPRAADAPPFRIESHPVPATTNLLGVKGCGEAGCAGSLPAVMNALVDALAEAGVAHIDMPATPRRVWEALQAANRA